MKLPFNYRRQFKQFNNNKKYLKIIIIGHVAKIVTVKLKVTLQVYQSFVKKLRDKINSMTFGNSKLEKEKKYAHILFKRNI